MKNLTITINPGKENATTFNVKSEHAMWVEVKKIFDEDTTNHIIVEDENNKLYKDLTIQTKSNGAKWMVNAVKETCRHAKKKDEINDADVPPAMLVAQKVEE